LSFELTITDKDGKTRNPPYSANVTVKRVHRAIIFQGGVALGAYEAGVFQAIVEKLSKYDEDKKRKDLDIEKRPLFDIVAGTSIGAMNGAIIVSSVMNEGKSLEDPKNWEDSAEIVKEFWRAQRQFPTQADFLDMNPFYHYWWDIIHNTSKVFKHTFTELLEFYSNINPDLNEWYENMFRNWSILEPSFWKDYFIDGWYIPGTAESARRYYSAKQFLRTIGPVNVASGTYPWLTFGKFFDILEQPNYMPRPDNKHYIYYSLKRTLERFAHFPIKTSPLERKEPRLLLVSVDVKTGDAVTFDSYSEQANYHDRRNIINYENGIEIEHALATGTFPDFFDYPKFKVEIGMKNEEHIFWDGGFRSNTPLREVLQAHRDYWLSRARDKVQQHTKHWQQERDKVQQIEEEDGEYDKYENVVPDLEIYIADLWPSELREDPISFDRDFVENKKWNLILGDKTDYDEQVASVVTDYVDLTRQLKNLAEQKGASKKEINHILNSYATSINTIGKPRIYKELLEGRFRLTKVVHTDHKDDGNEVNDKVFDYSYKTIEELMTVGYQDALVQMDMQSIKDEVTVITKRNIHH
jgi:NTE family protein